MWQSDQNYELSMFLKYGRDLSPDEMENLFEVDGEGNPVVFENSPKLSDFQFKVST